MLLNNIETIFKAQLTNAFFATVNEMFGGSYQLRTTAECAEGLGGANKHLTNGSNVTERRSLL